MEAIWPNNTKIDVLGVTGDYQSGKTLFITTIDPAHTLYYDFEKSGGTYESLGFDRVDFPEVCHEKYPKGFSPRQAFELWYEDIKTRQPGAYSVIAVDPISDIENGMIEWVKSRYKTYGFRSMDAFQNTGGIFWEKVKAEWKNILANIASRCQTFAYTSHLKQVWQYGKPTGKQIPKGKSTLMELTSLYLFLERKANDKGVVPLKPSATKLKDRLSVAIMTDDGPEVRPLLPPRLAEATPQAIRKYILNPPDYSKLKAAEKEKPEVFSEEERLRLEAQIAEDKRAAEESALERMQRMAQAEEAKRKALEAASAPAEPTPSVDRTAEVQQAQQEVVEEAKRQEAAVKEEPEDDQEAPFDTNAITEAEAAELLTLASKAGLRERVLKGIHRHLVEKGVQTAEEAVNPLLLSRDEFKKRIEIIREVLKQKQGS